MFSAIANGKSTVRGFLAGEDCLCTLKSIEQMGIAVERPASDVVIVHGKGLHGLSAPDAALDMGNSGTAMRLFAGLLCGQSFDSRMIGDASLSRRPMNRVIHPLALMGARIDSDNGKPPLVVHGGDSLHSIHYELPVASAQVKSAILLAGLYAAGSSSVVEPHVTRDHTERMLQAMGVNLSAESGRIEIAGGQALSAIDLQVPADLSSAAFPLLATLLSSAGATTIKNVGINPTRTGILTILRHMGADIELSNERWFGAEPVADITARASILNGIEVDPSLVSLAIDEFPLLFVAGALARGITVFTGAAELRVKESDRIGAMAEGLKRLGVEVDEFDDGAVVHGGSLKGGSIDSHGDHRIAMSFAIAASRAAGPIIIRDADAVNTSFPGFASCLSSIGMAISEDSGDPNDH